MPGGSRGWGDRRLWMGGLVLLLVGVTLVAVLVVGGEDDAATPTIGTEGIPGYPPRGELVDQASVTEAALEAWQGKGDEPIEGPAEVLYAAEVDWERLGRSGGERDVSHQVVVLAVPARVAVMHRPDGEEWDVLTEAERPVDAGVDALLSLGDGMHLASSMLSGELDLLVGPDRLQWQDAVEDPEQSEPEDPEVATETVDVDVDADPLLLTRSAQVMRVPDSADHPGGRLIWLDVEPSSQQAASFTVETAAPEGTTIDEQWDAMLDTRVAGPAMAMFDELARSWNDPEQPGAPSTLEERRTSVTWQLLGDRSFDEAPDPGLRVVASALGSTGSGRSTSELVAVALERERSRLVRVIGEGTQDRPVAGAWVVSELGGRPYLVHAADPGLDLELRVAGETSTPAAGVGVAAPEARGAGPGNPVLLFGEDGDGVAHPSSPLTVTMQ